MAPGEEELKEGCHQACHRHDGHWQLSSSAEGSRDSLVTDAPATWAQRHLQALRHVGSPTRDGTTGWWGARSSGEHGGQARCHQPCHATLRHRH